MKLILYKLKKRLILFLVFFLICFLSFPGFLHSDDVEFPAWTGYINDYIGLLDSSSRDNLENLASRIEGDTGSEIAVVIVDSLQGITEEEYAVELFEEWGIGKDKEDNGILILICTEGEVGKRPLRIEVGYGLEGVITDLEAGNIINEIIVPNFSSGNFYTGLYNAIIAISDQIYIEEGLEPLSSGGGGGIAPITENPVSSLTSFFSGFPSMCWCCFPIPLVIIIIIILVNFFKKRCPRCRKFSLKIKSTILKAATYTAAGRKLVERVCSNCGYSDKKEVTIPKKSRTSYLSSGSGGGGISSGGGGFGGFGGGSSGGGGASGSW